MAQIGLFFGSSTGNTENAAELIQKGFQSRGLQVDMYNVMADPVSKMEEYDILILGIPTWDIGELQEDWKNCWDDLDSLQLAGKKAALFGQGDQRGYPATFQDCIGLLGHKVRGRGATLVGFTSTEGFDFDESAGLEEGKFMGLSLDDDNQRDLTEGRIQAWVEQLVAELNLVPQAG
ncbi:MAG: flavodoxin [Anaerolineales bacterium]|nr:flavodoxin [Anaerolineales bacterium]